MSDQEWRDLLAPYVERIGGLLAALHRVMREAGYIDRDVAAIVADVFNRSQAEIRGVVSFYDDFRTEPVKHGSPLLRICAAESCQARGARELLTVAQARIGAAAGAPETANPEATEQSQDVGWEPVYCLGLCTHGPAVSWADRQFVGVTPDLVLEIAGAAQEETAGQDATSSPAAVGKLAPISQRERVYVPADALAVAQGADRIADAFSAQDIAVVRTGTRALSWLDVLVEFDSDAGRLGCGGLDPAQIPALVGAWRSGGTEAVLRQGVLAADQPGWGTWVGLLDDLPYLKRQSRQLCRRIGVVDPVSLVDYEAHGGLLALRRMLAEGADFVLAQLQQSGLRGRGGAAFPTAIKWQAVRDAIAAEKDPEGYVVCNADEGDAGTFVDRVLMESDPFALIESMTIAGLTTGCTRGIVYLRSEYPIAALRFTQALKNARNAGLLGSNVLGSGRCFDVELVIGAGSYVCGEETALLASVEGRRGEVRAKPPLPVHKGLFGRPTLLQNVVTFCSILEILNSGGAAYGASGVGPSAGTMPFQLSGNVRYGGIVELPFGVALETLVYDFGGGSQTGRSIRAVQVGGPLGGYLPRQQFATPLTYEAMAEVGAAIGHGGIIVFDEQINLRRQAQFAFEFCAHESCGKCTPCRIGAVRGAEMFQQPTTLDAAALESLCEVMESASLCAMGSMTPMPVRSALKYFPEDFE